MKILSVDTSSKNCSVAIVHNKSVLAEITTARNQTHSKHLLTMIDSILSLSELSISDLDGFGVTKGPGSFTGLRIGISTIKGLAFASGKPVVGISSLDTLANQVSYTSCLVGALLDARKNEVYYSFYRFENNKIIKVKAEGVASLGRVISDVHEPCLFVGDGAELYRNMIIEKFGKNAFFAQHYQNVIRATTLAYLAVERFKEKKTDDIDKLVPDYIRKSDAEILKP